MITFKQDKKKRFRWDVRNYKDESLCGSRKGHKTPEDARLSMIEAAEIMIAEIGFDPDNMPKCKIHGSFTPGEIQEFLDHKEKQTRMQKFVGIFRRV